MDLKMEENKIILKDLIIKLERLEDCIKIEPMDDNDMKLSDISGEEAIYNDSTNTGSGVEELIIGLTDFPDTGDQLETNDAKMLKGRDIGKTSNFTENNFKSSKEIIRLRGKSKKNIKFNTRGDIIKTKKPILGIYLKSNNKDCLKKVNNETNETDQKIAYSSEESTDSNQVSCKEIDRFANHTGNVFCQCLHCCDKFNIRDNANQKCNAHICEVCNKKFNQKAKLKMHKESLCGTLKLFSCEICAIGFTASSSLKDHIDSIHRNKEDFTRNYRCKICNKSFYNKKKLMCHNRTHDVLLVPHYNCEICKKTFSSKKSFSRHNRREHGSDRFECGHCGKIYKAKYALYAHIQAKHMVGKLKCGLCSSSFYSEESLQKHKLSQHAPQAKVEVKMKVCEVCGKSFKHKYYQRHLFLHTGEKPFLCNICGKSFRSDSNLMQHSVTHSDKRPYKCDLCEKSFRIRNHLRQHMAVHGMAHTQRRAKSTQYS